MPRQQASQALFGFNCITNWHIPIASRAGERPIFANQTDQARTQHEKKTDPDTPSMRYASICVVICVTIIITLYII